MIHAHKMHHAAKAGIKSCGGARLSLICDFLCIQLHTVICTYLESCQLRNPYYVPSKILVYQV